MSTIQISALPAASAITADDLLPIEHDPSGTPVTQKATAAQVATTVRAVAGAYVTTDIAPSGATLPINAAQAAVDLRIKGTTDAALVFVDATNNRVGIGTATPATLLDVSGTLKATAFTGSGASMTGIPSTAASFQSLASDPASPTKGDVWYNTTTNLFKGCANLASWTTQGSSTVARRSVGGCGTKTAALAVAGYTGAAWVNTCDIFNGSSWSLTTAYTDLTAGNGVAGTTTSALSMCGDGPTYGYSVRCFSFNGTTWTGITNIPISHTEGAAFGSSATSAGMATGITGANTRTTHTWNGSAWTSQGLIVGLAGESARGGGTVSAGYYVGTSTGTITVFETFDGSTWATGPALAVGAYCINTSGSTSSIMAAGGVNSSAANIGTSQTYNGSSWAASASLNAVRSRGMSAGSSSSNGMVGLGMNASATIATAETFNTPSAVVVTFTQT